MVQNWSVADASAADLKAEVSATASKVALCLTDARGGSRRLSQPALGLYLSGCTGVGDTKLSNEDFVTIFERVTKLAPDFARGWDYLALSRSWIAESLQDSSPAAHAAAVQSTRETIAMARKLNPNSAMSYDAEYHLICNDTSARCRSWRKAPRSTRTMGGYRCISRMSSCPSGECPTRSRRRKGASSSSPEPYTRSQYILALAYSGQFSKAKADLAEARKKWPNDPAIDYADFNFQYRYGDARAALELLPRIANSSDAGMAPDRKVIAARLDPTPAKIEDAIAALKAGSPNDPPREMPFSSRSAISAGSMKPTGCWKTLHSNRSSGETYCSGPISRGFARTHGSCGCGAPGTGPLLEADRILAGLLHERAAALRLQG